MPSFENQLKEVNNTLNKLSNTLIDCLEAIYKKGIPKESDKIVIWIPHGHRYNLDFTYMTNEGSELEGDFSELSTLDATLNSLVQPMDNINDLKLFTNQVDVLMAGWLKKGLEKSSFNQVNLQKLMGINNVMAFYDLNTLKLLNENEVWE